MAHKAKQDSKARKESKAHRGYKVQLATEESRAFRATRALRATLEPLVRLVTPVPLDRRATLATQEPPVRQVPSAQKVTLDLSALGDSRLTPQGLLSHSHGS